MHEYIIKYRMSQWESCFGTKRTESRFKRMAVVCSDEDRQTLRELREMAMVTHRLSFSGSWFLKGNRSWIFIRRTEADTGAPMLWPPDAKSWLIRKDTGAGKEWRQEEKGTPEDELVVWHHRRNGHEFEQDPGDDERQGSLACYSPWRIKDLDTTEQQQQQQRFPHMSSSQSEAISKEPDEIKGQKSQCEWNRVRKEKRNM